MNNHTNTDALHLDDIQTGPNIQEITEKARQELATEIPILNPFPLQVLPPRIQGIIQAFHKAHQEPIDFYAAGVLACASALVGNKIRIRYKRGDIQPALLYAVLVGRSGLGKTPPLLKMLRPIFDMQSRFWDDFQHNREQWKLEQEINPKGANGEAEPRLQQVLVEDHTVESLISVLQHNPKGILLFAEEFSGWLKAMNQYRGGGDVEFWLSCWENKSHIKNRSSSGAFYVRRLYTTVIGGIQTDIAFEIADGAKRSNGFFSRLLFFFPEIQTIPPESDAEADQSVFDSYADIMDALASIEVEDEVLDLNYEAKARYKKFRERMRVDSNRSDNGDFQATLSKIVKYCLRLALVLELLEWAENHANEEKSNPFPTNLQISLPTMESAIKLSEYFTHNAMRLLDRIDNPMEQLSRKQKALYNALPLEFRLEMAKEVSAELELSNRTMYRLLGNRYLVQRRGRGVYEKLL